MLRHFKVDTVLKIDEIVYKQAESMWVRFLYNSLQFLVAEKNPVWNNMEAHALLGKRENNSAEKEGFLYASLPLPSCQNNENGNIEKRI